MKNDKNGQTDWIHRTHIRKLYPRPSYLDDDSDDEDDSQPVINISRETSDDNNSSDFDKSSAGGVECSTDIIKNEVANETVKTEADDSICSNQSQRQIVDESQLANLFKNVAKSKRKSRKTKTPTEPSRKSTRDRKKVEKLQIGSNKGQSYD